LLPFLKKVKSFIKNYYFLVFCAIALILPEFWLKGLLPGVFKESYVKLVAFLFDLGWISLIILFCVYALPKQAGRLVFAGISAFFIVFSFSEYVYYKIFDQFFWLGSIALAGEGAAYLDEAIKVIDNELIAYTLLALASTIIACAKWRHPKLGRKNRCLLLVCPFLVIFITHLCMQPTLHRDSVNRWDTWRKPRLVYKNFNDINKSYETTGLYQFTFLDAYHTLFPKRNYSDTDLARVDEYFAQKEVPTPNAYTGIFEGKNVIAVMMESMDTWMIDEETTPTLHYLLKNGIHFTNYNAPFFGSGFTFGAEFAFNTGHFTPVAAVSASNFSTHSFPYALPRLFKEAGYTVNSFHFNSPEFYNRGIMHKSFGYNKYNSFGEFGLTGVEAELDSNILKNDLLYEKMTESVPFFNFLVTYSAHLPYLGDDPKLLLAKEYRPDMISADEDEERNNIRILAADTDSFFRQLLERLEADGLLDDTVIVAYTDHYAYGVSKDGAEKNWKGDTLSYTVPAFIYAHGTKPEKIAKPMMTIDWAPTLVNLFGLKTDAKYIGGDIFSPDNSGFALFETWGFMDETGYYPGGEEEESLSETEHYQTQKQRVKESIETNDIIVLSDYYKKIE